jgi:hypothetical protein
MGISSTRTLAGRIGCCLLLLLCGAGKVFGQNSALTWRWSNPTPHGNNIVDMAWNGNLSIQVTELGQIYTGENFFGWLPQVSGTTNDLQSVIFYGNRIIITGANGTVGYSDDAVNFQTTSLNTTNWIVGAAASSNLVVAVGDNAVIYCSADGSSWHYVGQPPSVGGDWLLGAAWGAGTFVICGEAGYVATSPNGTNWTRRTSGVTTDLERVYFLSASNSVSTFPYAGFWAVTYDGKAIYSTNSGVTWYRFNLGATSTNILYTVTASPTDALVAGEDEARLGTSITNWSRQVGLLPNMAPVWTYYAALWNTNGAYQLAGDDGMMVQGIATNSTYDWQIQYDSVRDWLWQVATVNDLYVAVGQNARIMTSQNGVDWSVEAIPLTNSVSLSNTVFFCVGGTTNFLVASGTKGSLCVSPNNPVPVIVTNLDGTTFTNLVGTLGVLWYSLPAPTTNDLAGVCVFSNSFYLAGGNATLLKSGDGTNWTKLSVPTTNYISGLAASSNMIVATGDQGLIMTSPDGNTWTKRVSGTTNWLFRTRCLNGRFLAMGENGAMLQSNDAATWSAVSGGSSNWINDAVMVSNTCFAVGNNGTVLASTNFVDWTNTGTITPLSLYGAATQNGQLVTVGLQGSILRSQVIPDLTPPDIVSYTLASGENIFLVAGDPDQEFTLDSSTNLLNWVTGPLLDLIYGSGTLVFFFSQPTNPPPATFYRATLVP